MSEAEAKNNRVLDAITMATPTLAFVGASQFWALRTSLVCAFATSVALLVLWRIKSRPITRPLISIGIVTACAIGATATHEARGFFLVPALVPLVVTAVCLVTIAAGRPLTGLILNRAAGGPLDWRERPPFHRIYVHTTWACACVDAVNFALQAFFYQHDNTTVLAVAHVATGPLFILIVAWTIAAVRRCVSSQSMEQAHDNDF